MVDGVGGAPVTSQLQNAQTASLAAIKNEREQTEAVVRNLDDSTRQTSITPPPPPPESDRGRNLDVKV